MIPTKTEIEWNVKLETMTKNKQMQLIFYQFHYSLNQEKKLLEQFEKDSCHMILINKDIWIEFVFFGVNFDLLYKICRSCLPLTSFTNLHHYLSLLVTESSLLVINVTMWQYQDICPRSSADWYWSETELVLLEIQNVAWNSGSSQTLMGIDPYFQSRKQLYNHQCPFVC